MNFYLGIDFGTSGARGILIDRDGEIQAEVRCPFGDDSLKADYWAKALFSLLEQIPGVLRRKIQAIAINGTSSTVLVCDDKGQPVQPVMMYNDAQGAVMLKSLEHFAPAHHTVLSATSSLVKLLWMSHQENFAQARYFLHQADWLAFQLHGKIGISDYHNALKLGYDVAALQYPQWLERCLENQHISIQLPQIYTPGQPIGELRPEIRQQYGFSPQCYVCAGTTDSIAAFLASGAKSPGEAVTSLGSTLALKLLSRTPVEDARYGIYSHRFPTLGTENLWLAGGASNTGGAVLKQFFTPAELARLSQEINPTLGTTLDYYPLLKPGDRFPINDPNLPPRLTPRPDSDREFLHGLLASMARIEAQGYELLQQLGADQLIRVYTAGGGAANDTWTQIRQNYLQVPMVRPLHTEAAYGSALLARGMGNDN
ncbi:FGGY-family carbohydrate kinase [Calothrix sp. 336/3]|uniref:FGGY-family carbohydrate kinase n=1 Tax=Calothrix sp. 336/3 TaxID=1337936 RepID=UPI0004E3B509|nr:FGGY-family carbohydrate kinase [Calothrix sp. 336/3]AKG21111.1 carbohydrate kinase [Calothrix sp. 336/3]